MLSHQAMKVREAHDHWRDHHGFNAGIAGEADLRPHAIEIAGEARHVARQRAVPAQRGRDRLDARREWRIALVGEAVIILHIIDAAARETKRERSERMWRQPLRLERR